MGRKKIAQKQSADRTTSRKRSRPKYGYQAKNINGYERPAARRADPLAAVGSHGGGLMAELGSHQLDASSIFISAQDPRRTAEGQVHPLSVTGVGGRHIFPADRDCDDHVYCMFEFPGKGYYKDGTHEVADETRRSSSPIRRSTATASAATAKSCSAPRAR